MRDLQTPATLSIDRSITRNEMRSAVRVRSSALFIPCRIRKLHKGVKDDDRETIGQSVLA